MQLYIIRHGIALERHEWDGSDASRPLTDDGKKRARQVVETLKKDGKLEVDAIWSSPLTRALETAKIAAQVLSLAVKTVDALESGTSFERLEKTFKKLEPLPERLMLVGHEPDCGIIIAELVGDHNGDYALKKSGIAALKGDFSQAGMKLKWKLAPKDILND